MGALLAALLSATLLAPATADETNQAKARPATEKPKPYPLKVCLVSNEKLDNSMGEPVPYVYKGQQFKFCCKDCLAKFDKDPVKYVKRLEEKVKQQKEAEQWLKEHAHH